MAGGCNIARASRDTQARGSASARYPVAPNCFVGTDHDVVPAPNQGKPEKKRLLGKPGQPSLVRQLRVAKSELVESSGVLVDKCGDAKLLREPAQLAQRCGLLHQIDEMRPDTTLGEEPQRLAGVSAFFDSKNLYFQSVSLSSNE